MLVNLRFNVLRGLQRWLFFLCTDAVLYYMWLPEFWSLYIVRSKRWQPPQSVVTQETPHLARLVVIFRPPALKIY